MAKHIYVAQQAKGLKFRVAVNDKDVIIKFVNGQYSTDDDELAAVIDEAVKQPAISRYCKKADRTAAAEMAAQHAAMLKRTGAFKGGVTAHAMKTASEVQKQQRDAELLASAGPSIKEQFAEEENLVLTDPGETAPSPALQQGGDPTAGLPVGAPPVESDPADEGELPTEVVTHNKPSGLKLG